MADIMCRGLTNEGVWVHGAYVREAFDGCSRSLDHAIQPRGCYGVEIIPETVGQFTTSYDEKGVLVCEGDILSNGIYHLEVKWHKFNGRWYANNDMYTIYTHKFHLFKIIGNIHQHSELRERYLRYTPPLW